MIHREDPEAGLGPAKAAAFVQQGWRRIRGHQAELALAHDSTVARRAGQPTYTVMADPAAIRRPTTGSVLTTVPGTVAVFGAAVTVTVNPAA